MCVKTQQIEIAKTLYKLGVEIDVIQKMTDVTSYELFNELRKDQQ